MFNNYSLYTNTTHKRRNNSFCAHNNNKISLNLKNTTSQQQNILFIKYKFGMYKCNNVLNKRIKNKIYNVLNYVKYKDSVQRYESFKKRTKIIFSKKFNKLFFRSGRRVLIKHLCIKKYTIQKYISKKLTHFIKQPNTDSLKIYTLNNLLIKCNLFYTMGDADVFIQCFGVFLNDKIIYKSNYTLLIGDFFRLVLTKYIYKFVKKKKQQVIYNFKKIKLYKFRIKQFSKHNNIKWIPINNWLLEYSCLYVSKYSNIEFDVKILSGCYFYNKEYTNLNIYYKDINTSLYMSRLYNWKYVT